MRPYHPANLSLQPFPAWRVIALSWVAKVLGVSFHVAGIPFGAEYNQKLWDGHYGRSNSSGLASLRKRDGSISWMAE